MNVKKQIQAEHSQQSIDDYQADVIYARIKGHIEVDREGVIRLLNERRKMDEFKHQMQKKRMRGPRKD